jgi:hypothetical protein
MKKGLEHVFLSLLEHFSYLILPFLPVLGREAKQNSMDQVQQQGHSTRGFHGK